MTPLRQQYLRIKKQFPDTIVMFRLGDFYETFDEDAKTVASVCNIVLTGRDMGTGNRVPLAGVPYHAVETYIAKLIQAGHKVAIVEQQGDPDEGRSLMQREVVRVVTPGTIVEPGLLEEKRNNYLAAVVVDKERAGICYVDITTGIFAATELAASDVRQELDRLHPAEILSSKLEVVSAKLTPNSELAISNFELPDLDSARRSLLSHFQVAALDGFGLAGLPLATRAAGAIIQYLQDNQKAALTQLTALRTYSTQSFMTLDPATRRNLELVATLRAGAVKGSLLGVLDETRTAMGARLLREWLTQPLLDVAALNARLDQVDAFYRDTARRESLRNLLKGIGDLERLANRVVQGIAGPRDLLAIRASLEVVPKLLEEAGERGRGGAGERGREGEGEKPNYELRITNSEIDPCPDVVNLIARAISPESPATLANGGVIAPGYSAELDGIASASKNAKDWVANLERKERERTGVKSLKVGYNKVFGYYIEVTSANAAQVPAEYIRKQTLVNAERFITPDLKEYESLILNADERIVELQTTLFREVCAQIAGAASRLLATARAIAKLDVVANLSEVAMRYRYVRPQLNEGDEIRITAGRHPVVELTLRDEPFVPNDVVFSPSETIHIITGPNMSGKCVRGDTIVFTDAGMQAIESLKPGIAAENNFAPVNYGVKGLTSTARATHFYSGGRHQTIRLCTRLGYELEGTPEHRIWVRCPSGEECWKSLGEITPGEFVAIDRQINLWGNREEIETPRASGLRIRRSLKLYSLPTRLTPDLAYACGLLTGDGTLREQNMISLTTGDTFIAQEFSRIMQEQFGYRTQSVVKSKHVDCRVTSRQIRLFFEELGMGYVTSVNKQIPSPILKSPRVIAAGFLQGLFDTDGYADVKGNVSLSTSSRILAKQVHALLLNFGIVSSLQMKRVTASTNPNYLVNIYGAEALTFYREIGFRLPRKQAGIKRVSSLRMPNVGGIPYLAPSLKQIQARIVATPGKPLALKHNKSINSIFYTYVPNKRNISYFKLDELIAYCQRSSVSFPEIEMIAERRYFYDPVTEITSGETEVFDLSVEGTHSFVANGFVNHNSTFLRQVALVVLMAQIGSFVPAEAATIGLVDRIFTRIGAQDEIAAGQSTFMVEMVEAANILTHSTRRSLIILDEIGRGTSTYDGIAIARAIVEHIHNHPQLGAKTLFATHYHELIELDKYLPKVCNYNVAVLEQSGRVIFLHKIVRGGADRSYGIHVAQLAGIPKAVVHRAEEVLKELESRREVDGKNARAGIQLALFSEDDALRRELQELDVLSLSPLEALNKLFELAEKAKGTKHRE